MWLLKEERHLLMFYTAYDHNFCGQPTVFSLNDLIKALTGKKITKLAAEVHAGVNATPHVTAQNSCDGSHNVVNEYKSWLDRMAKVESANKKLGERGLVELQSQDTHFYKVKLTLKGHDLGTKYNHWSDWTGLWYNDKIRNHWVVPVVSFGLGIVGTLIVQWLTH